jgi:hypothetical protein
MTIRTACALALASAVTLAAGAPAKQPKPNQPPPKPGALWRQYPLGSQPLTGTAPTTTLTLPGGPGRLPTPSATSPSKSTGLLVSAFVLGAAVLVLGAAGLVAARAYARRGSRSAEPITSSLATVERAAARLYNRRKARGIEAQPLAWDKFISTRERGKAMTDQLEEGVETAAPESDERRQSHADLGDRVAGVIKAAEEVAAQIRADAHEEASMIKRQAEDAAVRAIRDAAKERDELQATSEAYATQIRVTGESYATERRREAEADAAKLLADGEAQSRSLREAAEEMALRIETNALQRRDEIEERTRVIEAKLRRFQVGLASISEDVAGLLEPVRGQEETLTEALNVDMRHTPMPQSPAGQR